jgi:hypothetical protein
MLARMVKILPIPELPEALRIAAAFFGLLYSTV